MLPYRYHSGISGNFYSVSGHGCSIPDNISTIQWNICSVPGTIFSIPWIPAASQVTSVGFPSNICSITGKISGSWAMFVTSQLPPLAFQEIPIALA
ncbi:unnamed protein product, partial [Rotaria sp. Silwood1]